MAGERRRGEATAKLGGGEFSARVQRGEKLRPPGRRAEDHAARLLRGEAWRDLCRALERTGERLLEADNPRDERTLAEGFRYLLGLTTLGLREVVDLGDPERPVFVHVQDPFVKWGAENADNLYLQASVRGDRTYRIRGERGTSLDFLIEVKEGYMHLGDVRNFAVCSAPDLEIGSDGRFEILASASPQTGNWLPLHPDATQIVIRQYFYDWEAERPARFTIECLESAGVPAPPVTAAQVGRTLDALGHFVENTFRFWAEWMPEMRREHVAGRLQPALPFVGGADDIRYGNDVFTLAEDEAILIETGLPDARFWHFQLGSDWFVTLDYANAMNSLNGAQLAVDPDGRVRIVIAHADPGVPNWLDTGGRKSGMIQYRYVWTRDAPEPRIETLPFDAIGSRLPPTTPRVDPATRRDQIAMRQRSIARRFTR
ncbi:MAG: DUF1214 domain-containing protein [Myxococcota bacterium]